MKKLEEEKNNKKKQKKKQVARVNSSNTHFKLIHSCIVSLWDVMKSCEQDVSKTIRGRALKLGELIGIMNRPPD